MPVASNPAQDLIEEEFPSVYWPQVPAALKRAYSSVDAAYERLEMLGTPSGRYHRGDLVVLAVDLEFAKLVRLGHLPFDSSWDEYAAPTGKHLVLRSPGAHITINQVEYPHQKPRSAKFRDVFGFPNTGFLFPEWNERMRQEEGRKHVVLLHGHGTLRFANLAVPHPKENKLIWWTDDLLKVPHEVDVDTSRSGGEGPMSSPDAELVEDIVQEVRDRP